MSGCGCCNKNLIGGKKKLAIKPALKKPTTKKPVKKTTTKKPTTKKPVKKSKKGGV